MRMSFSIIGCNAYGLSDLLHIVNTEGLVAISKCDSWRPSGAHALHVVSYL